MAKTKTIFSCQQCGYQSAKWLGKCPDCNNWNTLVEETFIPETQQPLRQKFSDVSVAPQPLAEVEISLLRE